MTRQAIVDVALAQNGCLNGDTQSPNPFSLALNRPPQSWTGDFVSWVFAEAGYALPSMQAGLDTGFSSVSTAAAQASAALIDTWDAQLGDIALISLDPSGTLTHAGIVVTASSEASGNLQVMCGDSPATTTPGDPFDQNGGVHSHTFFVPLGFGDPRVMQALDASRLVTLEADPVSTLNPPATGGNPASPPLILKSPALTGQAVADLESALQATGHLDPQDANGEFDPAVSDAVTSFQTQADITVDAAAGPETLEALADALVTVPDPESSSDPLDSGPGSSDETLQATEALPKKKPGLKPKPQE